MCVVGCVWRAPMCVWRMCGGVCVVFVLYGFVVFVCTMCAKFVCSVRCGCGLFVVFVYLCVCLVCVVCEVCV